LLSIDKNQSFPRDKGEDVKKIARSINPGRSDKYQIKENQLILLCKKPRITMPFSRVHKF